MGLRDRIKQGLKRALGVAPDARDTSHVSDHVSARATPDPVDHPRRLDLVEAGAADVVSFGRLFIANPDLVTRLIAGAELALPDMSRAYGGDHRGYTDYPALAAS